MTLLFRYFYDGDVDSFRALLSPASNTHPASRGYSSGGGGGGAGSPGAFATSPKPLPKTRKNPGWGASGKAGALGKNEVNTRDHNGLTILLHAASSTTGNAIEFVEALLEHPSTDLYAQDYENGWNCLHRALYFGNISIARLLLDKERRNLSGETIGASISKVGRLIKTKDHDGYSPFDLFNFTIEERRAWEHEENSVSSDADAEDERPRNFPDEYSQRHRLGHCSHLLEFPDLGTDDMGEELFVFGSNKNLNLGLGDQDDRQFPERVTLKRPDHLYTLWYQDRLDKTERDVAASSDISAIPAFIQSRPVVIRDVVLSKVHSAVITDDDYSNLHVCGVGRGGRLGLGDENTRFTYTCVQGGLAAKKVRQVALGQNHTMALTENGELWTWGSNAASQLGYVLPPPTSPDQEPITTLPTRVFGALKKEIIQGIAASNVHSVAHTGTGLYCWGKNLGQLGLMDADSRSLEVQQTPRRVAASLLTSRILQVEAIDKVTICLLDNRQVICFTSYGYNVVKFPAVDSLAFGDIAFTVPRSVIARKSGGARGQIRKIAAAGATIAAVTDDGELFTFGLNQKMDDNATAMSTTNPSKIKNAITLPQCIWNTKRDGVRSVSIGEHGSVIICTHSGAVWRRVKRAKAKDAYVGSSSVPKRNDFKFQRIPGITGVIQVAASAFGAFAAIRRDSTLMRRYISVDLPSLWRDIQALNPLGDFRASDGSAESKVTNEDKDKLQSARLDPLAYEVLRSPDLESDLQRYLETWSYGNEALDVAICTSQAPGLLVPVHGWLLSARSSVLRQALVRFRKDGLVLYPDIFTMEKFGDKIVITFDYIDIISVLNLVAFTYIDAVIPAWNHTRAVPAMTFRYRQVRVELMKLALRLDMQHMEKAVRMQVDPEQHLDQDLDDAYHADGFFDDGDVLLELDGAAMPAHSKLLRQRCPWFDNLFQGRSGGKWLESRRDNLGPDGRIKIDLENMDPGAFKHVLRHLYSGADELMMFEDIVSPSVDDYIDLIMDVMGIADFLMLDRLAQLCQKLIGKFVNTRNIAWLLNDISPCAVKEFKETGLEYICLQIETMLENHLLDELDDELMAELDEVVRENQAAQQPFARIDRAGRLALEYPWLAEEIEEERRIRGKEMAYKKVTHKDEEKRLATSLRGRYGSLDDSLTPTPDRIRKVSQPAPKEDFTPDLRPKQSQNDLMFDMDDEDTSVMDSPSARVTRKVTSRQPSAALPPLSVSPGGELAASPQLPRAERTAPISGTPTEPSAHSGAPWKSAPLPTAKLDLRDVFKPVPSANQSGITAGLAAQKTNASTASRPAPPKMSQKERKKQQQVQAAEAALLAANAQTQKPAWDLSTKDQQAAPWKIASSKGKSPATAATTTPIGSLAPPSALPKPLVAAESSSQHVSRRTASPDTRFSGQSRTPSSNNLPSLKPPVRGSTPVSSSPSVPKAPGPPATTTTPTRLVPHSKSYIARPPKDEPLIGLSMADIIEQEQRARQEVKEAVAKRSLQEIQQEQAFQEWWDAESRRTQEEEARRLNNSAGRGGRNKDEGGKRGGRRGRSGKGPRGGANTTGAVATAAGIETKADEPADDGGRGKSRHGRGRGPATSGKV